MSQTERRQFSGEEKVKILRLHLLEGKAVSELCEQYKINPSLFYQWQRTFFENGSRAFEGSGHARSDTVRIQSCPPWSCPADGTERSLRVSVSQCMAWPSPCVRNVNSVISAMITQIGCGLMGGGDG